MSIAAKIELLKYILLTSSNNYELEIYRLLNGALYSEVDRIDDKSFYFKITPEKNKITAKQFMTYINEFIACMKTYFNNAKNLDYIMKEIIEENKQALDNLFNCECDDPYTCYIYEDKKIKENIYKLIISNFIKNAKYVPIIEPFLLENDIPLKEINNYNFEESEKVIKLLSDIAFSQRGKGSIIDLFQNIEYYLQKHLDIKIQNNNKYSTKDYEQKYLDKYISNYSRMFKSYEGKKKYLKHFK